MHLVFLLLGIGAAGGFLSGLLGVGGGIIFVPALYFSFKSLGVGAGHAMHLAVGTSLALIFLTGASSSFWHHRKGGVDLALARSWGPAVVAGVVVGTLLAALANGHFLRQFFAVMALAMACYMAFAGEPAAHGAGRRISLAAQRTVAGMIGGLAALIGVGGAILTVPFMTWLGVPMPRAVGTGSMLGLVIALPAALGYMLAGWPHLHELPPGSLGYVSLPAAGIIAPLCLLLSPWGVHAAHRTPRRRLRAIFAAVLMAVAARMFLTA